MADAVMVQLSGLLWWAVLKAPLLLAGAALTAWVLREASAATRHRVWATAVVASLALPVVALLVPQLTVDVPLPRAEHTRAVIAGPAPGPEVSTGARQSVAVVASPRPVEAAASRAPQPVRASSGGPASLAVVTPARARPAVGVNADPPSASFAVLLIWATVAVGLLLRIAVGAARARVLAARCEDVTDSALGDAVRRVAFQHGAPALRVLRGATDAMPSTWGIRHPVLLLPAGAQRWPAHRLEAVVRHELAHVRRRDVRIQLVADVLCALHWFDPLAWYAAHRLRVERELACDDEVLASGARPSAYASELVALARTFRERRLAGVAMAGRGGLRARVEAILDDRRSRGRCPAANVGIHAAAVVLALPLAALVPADGKQLVDADLPAPAALPVLQHFESVPVADVPSPRPVSPVQRATLCWEDVRDGASSVRRNRNDGRFEMEWRSDDCEVELRVDGELRYSDDFTRITGLSSGGFARFEEDDGRQSRRVELRPDGSGVALRWWVDGSERPFDAEAQRWLDTILLNAFRAGGLATEERAAWMVRTQGVDGLMQEIPLLRGDWVRGMYIRAALASPDLDDARAVTLIRETASTIDSDHTKMEILEAVAANRSLSNDAVRAAFIDAAATIDSDHARGESLRAALLGPELPERDLAAILDAVADIDSDHTKSELLIQVAQRHQLTPGLRAAYLHVTASIDSDHSVGQAAEALLETGPLAASELELALEMAENIQSDHTLAELMRRLTPVDLRDAGIRRLYEEALGGIQSDHSLGEVLTDLLNEAPVDENTAGVVLRASRHIDSDHTLGQVLELLIQRGGVTEATRASFDEVLASIGSDHTRSQVERALRNR